MDTTTQEKSATQDSRSMTSSKQGDEERNSFESKRWKYEGYPSFTKWIASSSNFALLRRFNRLNAWVHLDWQDEIVRLEDELEEVNCECQRREDAQARCDSVRPGIDTFARRREIVRALRPLLKDYNEFILSYSELRARRSADPRSISNVDNWFWNHEYAIHEPEQRYVYQGTDVIPLVERRKPILRELIEHFNANTLARLFPVKPKEGRMDSPTTTYRSEDRINFALTSVIVGLGLVSLLGPMWWLNYVSDNAKRLGIISGFIVLFALILASATIQRPFEVLAGTAAYAAVLIVFLQQSSPAS